MKTKKIDKINLVTATNRPPLRYVASILLALLLCAGNAWADINWVNYSAVPVTNGEYYLFSENAKYFFNTPTEKIYNSTSLDINGTGITGTNPAILFKMGTVSKTAEGKYSITTISFQKNSTTYYLHAVKTISDNANWLKTTGAAWNLEFADATLASTYYSNTNQDPAYYMRTQETGTYSNQLFYAIARTNSSTKETCGQLATRSSLDTQSKKGPWLFISPAAYEDATGTQYYYTVGTQVYVNGASNPAGGTLGVLKPTYKKPACTDWTTSDYATSIGQKHQGASGDSAIVTIYAKVVINEGYDFEGFSNGSGKALTEQAAVAANTYYEVDADDHIYRVSFAANGTSSAATPFVLRANYTQSLEPVANVYDTNDGVNGYATFAEALAAAQNGYRLELLADVENLTSTITINKGITLDFNGFKIKSAATDAPTNLIEITDGNVTFVDNAGIPGGVTSTGATAVLVSDGSLTIKDGKYQAATYAVQRTDGSVTIKNGGFTGNTQDINGTITLNGGYFVHNAGLSVSATYAVTPHIPLGMKYSTGYYYMVVSKSSPNYPLCTVISKGDDTISINFSTLEAAIAYANNNANDGRDKTILLRESCTLPAGNYTIPQYTTLVIPHNDDQSDAQPHILRLNTDDIPSSAYCTLTLANGAHLDVFGAIEVGGRQTAGTMNATAISRPGGDTYGLMMMEGNSSIALYGGANLYAWGFVQGTGTIDVRRGATVKEQFQINDWKTFSPTAFMAQGTGSGGSPNYSLHVLPINQYFIQNVEVKATYRPGSHLLGQVCANVLGLVVSFNDVGIIGVKYSEAAHAADPTLKDDVAIFLMDNEDDSEDTWVRKSYDAAHDTQLYEVNNAAYLGSLSMYVSFKNNPTLTTLIEGAGFGEVDHLDVDSKDFVLALSNNFKIHLLNGNLTVTQNTVLLPGAVIEVNKKSTLTIAPRVWDDDTQKWINTPQTLSLYDYHQWETYAAAGVENNNMVWAYATHVKFRPNGTPDNSVRDISSAKALGNGQLIVHGKVDVQGYLRTTTGDFEAFVDAQGHTIQSYTVSPIEPEKAGGSSIVSTVDAGTIFYSRAVPAEKTTSLVYDDFLWQTVFDKNTQVPDYEGRHVIPALLKNEDGSFVHTANTDAGKSFCFIDFDEDGDGEWKCLTDEGCFVKDENNVYYIKPQAYVPIKQGSAPVAEADHTYRDRYAGTNKIYIQLDDCQWWEVKAVEGHPELFKCEHPDNTTYYYWDDSDADASKHKWAEKKYKVEWMDWNGDSVFYVNKAGDKVNYYFVTYHTTPTWLGNAPSREMDDNYTYEFAGWSPTPAPVEEDVVYTATYEKKVRSYTITFKDKAGHVIENQYVDYGTQPSCHGYTLAADEQWNPAIGIVTKDQIYQVDDMNPGPFTITFVNWNGSVLKIATNVAKNTSAENVAALYNIDAPNKLATKDETYTFNGWTPAIVEATADAVYTATFRVDPKTYEIKFYDENNEQLGETQNVAYGAMPAVPDYSKTATAEATYTLSWRDGEGGTILVGVATKNQSYYAHFDATTRQYEVRWINEKGEVFDAQSLTYGSTPTYHGVTPTQAVDAEYSYEFAGSWKDENGTTYDGTDWAMVTGNKTYTAQFTPVTIAPIVVDEPQTITDNREVNEVRITTGGSLDVTGHINTVNFILESNGDDESGQLVGGAGKISISGNAYFDRKIDGGTQLRTWYAVAVPWEVDAETGISIANGRQLVIGRDFDIIYYNGAKRAAQGNVPACWEYVEWDVRGYDRAGNSRDIDKRLHPGRLYMMYFAQAGIETVRFAKAAGASIIYSSPISVETYAEETGNDGKDANWNGIANPRTYYATLGTGTQFGYLLSNGNVDDYHTNGAANIYSAIEMSGSKFIVGQPVFVQAVSDQSVVVAKYTNPSAAPARRAAGTDNLPEEIESRYALHISAAGQAYSDNLFIQTAYDKTDVYTIGQDLVKAGVAQSRAQMWVNRYDAKLSVNTAATVGKVYDFPLGIYVPASGEYTINLENARGEAEDLYLTKDGRAIWNLSVGAYTATFEQGTSAHYGLRTKVNSPAVTTAIDEAVVDAQGATRKALINGQVYVIRNGEVYSVDGRMVK